MWVRLVGIRTGFVCGQSCVNRSWLESGWEAWEGAIQSHKLNLCVRESEVCVRYSISWARLLGRGRVVTTSISVCPCVCVCVCVRARYSMRAPCLGSGSCMMRSREAVPTLSVLRFNRGSRLDFSAAHSAHRGRSMAAGPPDRCAKGTNRDSRPHSNTTWSHSRTAKTTDKTVHCLLMLTAPGKPSVNFVQDNSGRIWSGFRLRQVGAWGGWDLGWVGIWGGWGLGWVGPEGGWDLGWVGTWGGGPGVGGDLGCMGTWVGGNWGGW